MGSLGSGYKGFGLGLFVEMMTGLLAGSHVGPDIGQSMNPNAINRTEAADLGQCFMAINPSLFGGGGGDRGDAADGNAPKRQRMSYGERMAHLATQLHELPTATDAPGPVLLPGEKEAAMEAAASKKGVQLSDAVTDAPKTLAKDFGVEFPS